MNRLIVFLLFIPAFVFAGQGMGPGPGMFAAAGGVPATEILRPTSDGVTTAWTASSGTDLYLMVDEATKDDDTTYCQAADRNNFLSFNFTTALTTETITSIVVNNYIAGTGYTLTAAAQIEWNATTPYAGTANPSVPDGSYVLVSHEWTVNPYTGVAWVPSDIAAFTFGSIYTLPNKADGRVTQTWIEVNYNE